MTKSAPLRACLVLLGLFFWLLGTRDGDARKVISIPPEELASMASVICNGEVLSVKQISPFGEPHPKMGDAVNVEVDMVAQVKVLHVSKGKAAKVITYQFRAMSTAPGNFLVNPPAHAWVAEGRLYRFFLRAPQKSGAYTNVLDGITDDACAVVELRPDGPRNNNPVLPQKVLPKKD